MKALFAHCHRFIVDESGQARSDKLPYATWCRYLEFCDQLTVVGRQQIMPGAAKYPLSSGERVRFVFMQSISSPTSLFGARGRARRIMQSLIRAHDFVIARVPSEYGFLAADVADELGKPCLLEVVGCAWDSMWNHGGLAGRLYAPLYRMRMRRTVRRARYASYVSQDALQARYPASDGAELAAVSNVEIPALEPVILERRLARIRTSGPLLRVGLIGSLKTRYKGVQTAIAALAATGERGRFLELRVLGDGEDTDYRRLAVRLGVEARVKFDGVRSSGAEVFAWLDEIDLYVQPSFQEGVPRALIEALSRGCPAIASTAGGIPELLEPAWLFAPGDHRAMAARLQQLAGDKWMQDAQARRNFEKAREYQTDVLTERRRKILRDVQLKARMAP